MHAIIRNLIAFVCLWSSVASAFLLHPQRCHHGLTLRRISKSVPGDHAPEESSPRFLSRKDVIGILGGVLGGTFGGASANAETDTEAPTSTLPCAKAGASTNCVSTASVRQVDLYMAPWTFPETMSAEEAMARLKGVIQSDTKLETLAQADRYLKVRGTRNFCVDEIEFLINPEDRVITFVSRQVDGPDATDFGANRKRLDELRRKAQVFGVMGQDFATADASPKEGALGQLKAFYGLQSGKGFEDLFLDED